MSRIDERLAELGISLPAAMVPPGNFKLVNVDQGVAYVAGHAAMDGSRVLVQGVVGEDLSVEQGYEAARLAGLTILASLKQELGDWIEFGNGFAPLEYVQTVPGFHDNAQVVNGFSDLTVEIWGEAGRHARSAPGQGPSPLNVPVIVDAFVAVTP